VSAKRIVLSWRNAEAVVREFIVEFHTQALLGIRQEGLVCFLIVHAFKIPENDWGLRITDY
jgi:hypothetical protein